MSNFHFLNDQYFRQVKEQAQFAEKYIHSDPRASTIYSRLALEYAVYWVYENDQQLPRLRKLKHDFGRFLNLDELMNLDEFRDLLDDEEVYNSLFEIKRIGNRAVHRNQESITKEHALNSAELLYNFLMELAIYYQKPTPEIKPFDVKLIPSGTPAISQREQQQLIEKVKELEENLEELQSKKLELLDELEQIDAQREEFRKRRLQNAQHAKIKPSQWTEEETRYRLIDVLLMEAGWDLAEENVKEFSITGLPKTAFPSGTGRADYVLWDDKGLPLAIIEAKKTIKSADNGRHQTKLYAEGLERIYGRRPFIYYSNGFTTWFWEDTFYPPRQVMGFMTKDELEWSLHKRSNRIHPLEIEPNKQIVGGQGRSFQLKAVSRSLKRFCDKDQLIGKFRRGLLVMATGAGKTRTAAAIIEVLAKANWVKRTLFLADRNALVDQAKRNIAEYLPGYTCVDITQEDDDLTTRVVFSTYQTIINRIEHEDRQYSIGHFDFIIVDEAHRSIYNKYRSIFSYFDALVLGLTATPRDHVDFDTFEFFNHSPGEPLYSYDLQQAAEDGHLLLPKGKQVDLGFMKRGIRYAELSDVEKRRYEETFADEHGHVPDHITPRAMNEWLYNKDTIKKVLEILMRSGLKVADKVGKTIIFAKNRHHAELIQEVFNEQYSHYSGDFCQTIHYQTEKSGDLIDRFKDATKLPRIAVSVDMLDTGIDVPELVNLIFFKPVYSKAKYWQMVGRGTRKSPNLFGPGLDKEYFYIFDFCGNFEFFNQNPEGFSENSSGETLSQRIFTLWINLSAILNEEPYSQQQECQEYRNALLDMAFHEVDKLSQKRNNISVRGVLETLLQYLDRNDWNNLQHADRIDLVQEIAPIVEIDEPDQYAKRFDILIHRMQVAHLTNDPDFVKMQAQVYSTAESLRELQNVPEVQKKMGTIRKILKEDFWKSITIGQLENIRKDLRSIVRHIDPDKRKIYHTNFIDRLEGEADVENPMGSFGSVNVNYHRRLESLLEAHRNHLAVQKVRKNDQITDAELKALQDILLKDVKEDQKEGFNTYLKEKPLTDLIRSVLGMERQAIKTAFAEFERTHRLSDIQMKFLETIIDAISTRGLITVDDLYERPFKDIHDGGIDHVFGDDTTEVINIIRKISNEAS